MPIRWPMSLYNCLGLCVCVSGVTPYPLFPSVHSLPMTNESGAIFLVQLTTRQFAGHPLGLRRQGGLASLLLLYSMLLIKFCCHLPTLPPHSHVSTSFLCFVRFGCVVGNFFKIVLVTFKLVSEWQQWSFAKMLSFRCCKVFIVSHCPFSHCPCLFSTLLADQKIKREEEKRKEGEHPHYSKFLAKSYCWLFFIFALLLHCLLSCLFVATLPIRICLSPSLPVSLSLSLSIYTYTAYLASMKVSVYFRKCNLPLPVACFASFCFVFFIVSAIFNWFCTI